MCGAGALARGGWVVSRHVSVRKPHVVELNPSRALGVLVTAGEVISTGVSISLKTRSADAIADCRMLYFSLRSMIGRKKRCAYCMNATSTPSVIAFCTTCKVRRLFLEDPMATLAAPRCRMISFPPNQMMPATAIDDRTSTTG